MANGGRAGTGGGTDVSLPVPLLSAAPPAATDFSAVTSPF